MMAVLFCEWDAERTKCVRCGKPKTRGDVRNCGPRSPQPVFNACDYLGDATGQDVQMVDCGGCKGARETAMFECSHPEHQYAAPLARSEKFGREDVTGCRFCPHNTAR